MTRITNTSDEYFTAEELCCSHCGAYKFDTGFRALLNDMRAELGFPLPVTSGYRCPEHPLEKRKGHAEGAHTTGKAIDIAVSGSQALALVELALKRGVTRIGVNQKGAGRFIHLDKSDLPGPTIWSY